MKTINYLIILSCFIASCGNENNDNSQLEIQGQLVKYSDCKGNENQFSIKPSQEISNDVSQVDYSYDVSTKTLTLKHINSAFNCCPDNLDCNISFIEGTIIIEESEYVTDKCRCNCLYDIDILITGVESKKYSIRFIEPYYSGEQKLIFDIDLKNKNEGSFKVIRNEYPWAIE